MLIRLPLQPLTTAVAAVRPGASSHCRWIALAPLLLLCGCAQAPAPPVDITALTPPASPAAQKAAAEKLAKARSEAGAGLEPLATPQQVLSSVPLGRRDPFGQLLPSFLPTLGPDGKPIAPGAAAGPGSAGPGAAGPGAAAPGASATALGRGRSAGGRAVAAGQPPLQLPNGFSISGVIRSGGISEAVVSYGALSGSLRPGDRGGHTTDLLPSGWSVASVDVNQGQLTLLKDGRRVTAQL